MEEKNSSQDHQQESSSHLLCEKKITDSKARMAKEEEPCLVEVKKALMVSFSGDHEQKRRKGHFIKHHGTPFFPNGCTSTSLDDFAPRKVSFNGWSSMSANWVSWINKLRPIYGDLWKQLRIFDAIQCSCFKTKKELSSVFGVSMFWCGKTNTFIFPWGEATITLEDVMVLGRFPVFGEPVTAPLAAGHKEIEERMTKERKKFNRTSSKKPDHPQWISHYLESGKCDEVEHIAFISLWLSKFVFPRHPMNTVTQSVFPLAIRLARGEKIALAPAVLATLYQDLRKLKQYLSNGGCFNGLTVWAPFNLLQIWIWEHFVDLRPKEENAIKDGEPRMSRWHNVGRKLDNSVVMSVLRSPTGFHWRPYTISLPHWDKPSLYSDKERWLHTTEASDELRSFAQFLIASELVGPECIEQYLPHRVAMQFGFDQDVPVSFVRANSTWVEAWRTYEITNKDVYFCIPSQFSAPEVTVKYFKWWNKHILTLKRRRERDVGTTMQISSQSAKKLKSRDDSEKEASKEPPLASTKKRKSGDHFEGTLSGWLEQGSSKKKQVKCQNDPSDVAEMSSSHKGKMKSRKKLNFPVTNEGELKEKPGASETAVEEKSKKPSEMNPATICAEELVSDSVQVSASERSLPQEQPDCPVKLKGSESEILKLKEGLEFVVPCESFKLQAQMVEREPTSEESETGDGREKHNENLKNGIKDGEIVEDNDKVNNDTVQCEVKAMAIDITMDDSEEIPVRSLDGDIPQSKEEALMKNIVSEDVPDLQHKNIDENAQEEKLQNIKNNDENGVPFENVESIKSQVSACEEKSLTEDTGMEEKEAASPLQPQNRSTKTDDDQITNLKGNFDHAMDLQGAKNFNNGSAVSKEAVIEDAEREDSRGILVDDLSAITTVNSQDGLNWQHINKEAGEDIDNENQCDNFAHQTITDVLGNTVTNNFIKQSEEKQEESTDIDLDNDISGYMSDKLEQTEDIKKEKDDKETAQMHAQYSLGGNVSENVVEYIDTEAAGEDEHTVIGMNNDIDVDIGEKFEQNEDRNKEKDDEETAQMHPLSSMAGNDCENAAVDINTEAAGEEESTVICLDSHIDVDMGEKPEQDEERNKEKDDKETAQMHPLSSMAGNDSENIVVDIDIEAAGEEESTVVGLESDIDVDMGEKPEQNEDRNKEKDDKETAQMHPLSSVTGNNSENIVVDIDNEAAGEDESTVIGQDSDIDVNMGEKPEQNEDRNEEKDDKETAQMQFLSSLAGNDNENIVEDIATEAAGEEESTVIGLNSDIGADIGEKPEQNEDRNDEKCDKETAQMQFLSSLAGNDSENIVEDIATEAGGEEESTVIGLDSDIDINMGEKPKQNEDRNEEKDDKETAQMHPLSSMARNGSENIVVDIATEAAGEDESTVIGQDSDIEKPEQNEDGNEEKDDKETAQMQFLSSLAGNDNENIVEDIATEAAGEEESTVIGQDSDINVDMGEKPEQNEDGNKEKDDNETAQIHPPSSLAVKDGENIVEDIANEATEEEESTVTCLHNDIDVGMGKKFEQNEDRNKETDGKETAQMHPLSSTAGNDTESIVEDIANEAAGEVSINKIHDRNFSTSANEETTMVAREGDSQVQGKREENNQRDKHETAFRKDTNKGDLGFGDLNQFVKRVTRGIVTSVRGLSKMTNEQKAMFQVIREEDDKYIKKLKEEIAALEVKLLASASQSQA